MAVAPSLIDFFSVREIPDRVPRRRGRKLHRSAGYRWTSSGLVGVRLQTLLIGGELHTCEQWLLEFFEAVTEARRLQAEGDR